ncbi:MAG: TonB-dependent receptor, partial [Cyanobacteria bacterium J06636_28]
SLGLFAQGTCDISDQFQLSGGIRYEDVGLSVDDYQLAFGFSPIRDRQGGSNSFDEVLFNAGLLYRPISEIGLFANFAQGFSIPNVGSALALVDPGFDVTADDLLLPQKVDNYEIGVRADFDRVQATLAGFYNESDLGSAIAVDFATNQARVERAPQRNYGVEATLDWQPSDTWRLGGLFSWNEGENDVDDDGDFDALSFLEIDPVKIGLYLENETTPGWTNRLDALIIGTRDRSVDAGVDPFAGEGYTIVDFTSNIRLNQGVLSLGIGNLFNNDYGTIRQQNKFNVTQRSPGLGRTFQVRYSVNF